MSYGAVVSSYDSLGRLIKVTFVDGASATYSYDNCGNRTSVIEVPGSGSPPIPTVAAFPKRQQGDFKNQPMIVMMSNGQLIGWGDNTTGALANGLSAASSAPAQRVVFDPNTTVPPFSETIVDWAFTNANLYVVFSNGWVYSAGANDYGQLGHGDTVARAQLSRIEYFVQQNVAVTNVWACGGYSTTNGGGCAYFLSNHNSLYGVGNNAAGNLGIGNTTNQSTPVSNLNGTITGVAITCSGVYFTVYAYSQNANSVWSAGFNGQGQCAVGSTTNITSWQLCQKSDGSHPSNFVKLVANGGAAFGNVIALDSAGNVWTAGYNGNGELAQGNTTNLSKFTQVSALSNINVAELGGGDDGYGYALNNAGTLYTWGYNGGNNLFFNNTTTPKSTPSTPADTPGRISKVFFPKANNLSTSSQLIVLTSSGLLAYAGVANGQNGIANTVYPGAYSYIPMPLPFEEGTETISDVFVHGTSTAQRWFILSNLGNLYACGSNINSICTGGIASNTAAANLEWYKISLQNQ